MLALFLIVMLILILVVMKVHYLNSDLVMGPLWVWYALMVDRFVKGVLPDKVMLILSQLLSDYIDTTNPASHHVIILVFLFCTLDVVLMNLA